MRDARDGVRAANKHVAFKNNTAFGGQVVVLESSERKVASKSYDAALRVQTRCARVGEERTIAS